jgi:hypothetical protein
VKIGVVVSDAGAAQHLSLLTKDNNERFLFHIVGTAKKIFELNKNFAQSRSLDEIFANSSHIYIGRSWESGIGLDVIEQAKISQIETTLFLDHWGFEAQEFTKDGKLLTPSNVIVFDEYAFGEATALFPGVPISIHKNLYLSGIKASIETLKLNKPKFPNSLLYLSEPIDRHLELKLKYAKPSDVSLNFSEMQAFDYMLSKLDLISTNIDSIVIRPHPADILKDLEETFLGKDSRIRFSESQELISDIYESDYVAGSQTFGLAISVMTGKKTYSIIPPGGGNLVIPYDDIIMLRDL